MMSHNQLFPWISSIWRIKGKACSTSWTNKQEIWGKPTISFATIFMNWNILQGRGWDVYCLAILFGDNTAHAHSMESWDNCIFSPKYVVFNIYDVIMPLNIYMRNIFVFCSLSAFIWIYSWQVLLKYNIFIIFKTPFMTS